MRRFRFLLARLIAYKTLGPYLGWFMLFWLVQTGTAFRSVCAVLPTHAMRSIIGARPKGSWKLFHIHWCGEHEGWDHEPHHCHGCPMVWYDRVKPLATPPVAPAKPASDDRYAFTVYA